MYYQCPEYAKYHLQKEIKIRVILLNDILLLLLFEFLLLTMITKISTLSRYHNLMITEHNNNTKLAVFSSAFIGNVDDAI